MVTLRALALWLFILVLAVANGGLREAVLVHAFSRPAAFTLSGLLLIACIFAATALFTPWLGRISPLGYVLIGLLWVALTLVFEFSFGVLVRGESISSLLEAYKFKDGNLWPLVLVAVAIAPLVGAYLRHRLNV